jgi:hypothetical protein
VSAAPAAAPRPRPLVGDWVVLGLLLLVAIGPLVVQVLHVWEHGGVVTGSSGFLVADSLQYLNWLRQAGDHVLAGNLYDLAPGPDTFLHPLLLVSGLLHRIGLGVVAAYYVWAPVGVVALFWGAFRLAGRFLVRTWDRRVAVIVALFFASPVAALVGWTGWGGPSAKFQVDFVTGELWVGTYLWGYLFTAVAVGLMPIGMLAYERARAGGATRPLVLACAIGMLVAWCQPWQGATLAGMLALAEAVCWWRDRRPLPAVVRDLLPVLLAIAVPLVYFFVLSKTDHAWRLAGEVNKLGHWPVWVSVVGLAPLAVPAAFAYRLPAPTFADVAIRLWPLLGIVVFYQPFGTFPAHAFQGLALPLAVLALVAVRHGLGVRPLPAVATGLVVALLVVPGLLYRSDELRGALDAGRQAFYLTDGERDALRYMEASPQAGGVLTPVYTGVVVPAYTGRETWVGAGSWTPDQPLRTEIADRLFAGDVGAAEAQRIVKDAGPRFLFSPCRDRRDLTPLLGDVVVGPPRTFGCARVWEVRPQYVRPV